MTSNSTSLPFIPYAAATGSNSNVNLDVLSQLDIFLNCFLIHLLSLLGVLTNIFNIIFLSKHSFQETTNILLFSLSVCDLMCSILQPFRKINCFAERFNPVLAFTLKSFSSVYFYVLPDIFVSVSILHTALIAVERLVAVSFPLRVSRIFTPSRVKWAVLFLYVYAVGMLSPTLFLSDFIWIYDAKYNTTRGSLVLSKFYINNYSSLNQYASVATAHLIISCPLLVILSCSAVTGYKLTIGRSDVLKKITSTVTANQSGRDLRVVKMLLTVCVINATVAVPTVAVNMFLLYSNTYMLSSGQFAYVMRSVISVVYQLIATTNFIVYVTMSSKFAKTLDKVICRNTKS